MKFELITKDFLDRFRKGYVQSPQRQNLWLKEVGIIMQSGIPNHYKFGRGFGKQKLAETTRRIKKAKGYTGFMKQTGALQKWDYTIIGDTVSVHPTVHYAKYHEYGAEFDVPVTEKSRKYFWAMYFLTNYRPFMYMALTKEEKFHVKLPARPVAYVTADEHFLIQKAFRRIYFT